MPKGKTIILKERTKPMGANEALDALGVHKATIDRIESSLSPMAQVETSKAMLKQLDTMISQGNANQADHTNALKSLVEVLMNSKAATDHTGALKSLVEVLVNSKTASDNASATAQVTANKATNQIAGTIEGMQSAMVNFQNSVDKQQQAFLSTAKSMVNAIAKVKKQQHFPPLKAEVERDLTDRIKSIVITEV